MMRVQVLSVGAAVGIWLSSSTPRPAEVGAHSAVDSLAIRAAAETATADFLWVWRFYYESSEGMRHKLAGGTPLVPRPARPPGAPPEFTSRLDLDRRLWLHCHKDGPGGLGAHIIDAHAGRRAVCPVWSLARVDSQPDERLNIDAGIVPPLRSGLTLAREALLTTLDSAAAVLPGDAWIAGSARSVCRGCRTVRSSPRGSAVVPRRYRVVRRTDRVRARLTTRDSGSRFDVRNRARSTRPGAAVRMDQSRMAARGR